VLVRRKTELKIFSTSRAWAGYGADVKISTHDVTTESGCEEMLLMAKSMGHVDAIFNLAVILKDSIFQNQTPETFKTSFGPKAQATLHLDKFSKKHCPGLR
jgi:fatty acid synthase, animal type